MDKLRLFLENTRLLSDTWGIVPLLYGSLGLEYLTGEALCPDDIDILIPTVFLTERWEEFQAVLEARGYVLTDRREHTFEKNGVCCAYACLEELETFAGIREAEISVVAHGGTQFRLLSGEQYQRVYTASAKDGYRADVRGKKDAEKLAVIRRYLFGGEVDFPGTADGGR